MTGCSQIGGKEGPLLSAVVSRFPACAAEIKAFFALNKYIAQSGADRDLYDPALQALRVDQMTDCVDDKLRPGRRHPADPETSRTRFPLAARSVDAS